MSTLVAAAAAAAEAGIPGGVTTVVAALIAVFSAARRLPSNRPRPLVIGGGISTKLGGCAFSPEGVLLATTSNDLTVSLWWIPHGTTYAVLTGHTGWVRTYAFSPDGLSR